MPLEAHPVNPGSGGRDLAVWNDPVTDDDYQQIGLSDYRGGITYVASSGMITPGAVAAGLRVWGLYNPTASGVVVYVHRIFAYAHAVAAATSPVLQLQRAADVAGIATGTAVTLARPDNVAIGTPVPVIRNMPTSGTVGGGIIGSLIMPTVAGATNQNLLYDDNQMMYRDFQIAAGNSVLVVTAGATSDLDHRCQIDAVLEVI